MLCCVGFLFCICTICAVFLFCSCTFCAGFFILSKLKTMKKSTLYALAAVIAAIFSTLVVLKNFGTLYALPLLVLSFLSLSFYISVCDVNEQKQK